MMTIIEFAKKFFNLKLNKQQKMIINELEKKSVIKCQRSPGNIFGKSYKVIEK